LIDGEKMFKKILIANRGETTTEPLRT